MRTKQAAIISIASLLVPLFEGMCAEGKDTSWFSLGEIRDLPAFATKLINKKDPVSEFLNQGFDPLARNALEKWQAGTVSSTNLEALLVQHLNDEVLTDVSIYNPERFASVMLRSETKELLSKNPQGRELIRLNRILLEDAYPLELSKAINTVTHNVPIGIRLDDHEKKALDDYEKMMRDIPLFRHLDESPGLESRTRQFLVRIKARHNAKELLDWALPLMKAHETDQQPYEVPSELLPEFILKLDPPLEPRATVHPRSYVSLDWGGGFGFWGLFITGNSTPPSNTNLFLIEWVPGVHAYHTRDL